jgi:hypothetical protein
VLILYPESQLQNKNEEQNEIKKYTHKKKNRAIIYSIPLLIMCWIQHLVSNNNNNNDDNNATTIGTPASNVTE